MAVDQVRAELLAIKARSADGLLHAQDAVDWAKANPDSALAARLDWNDETAANSWRLHQMRHLIEYHVVSETGAPQVISLQVDRSNGGGYRDINEARVDMADIMMREAMRELRRVRMRYGHIKSLKKVWVEIDRLQPKATAGGQTTSRGASPAA
ncbi:hypothetical protein A1D31_22610 [Bradyrhizobium liaoningense]|nr:hypothetical protein A1D31_22610 [Bradyrhizobium liaoningense]